MAEGKIRLWTCGLIRLMDSFTGTPVPAGQVRVLCREKIQLQSKPDGYLVLVSTGEEAPLSCRILSPKYREQEVQLSGKIPDTEQIIWLHPDKNYVFPPETGFLTGTGDEIPGAFVQDKSRGLTLTADTGKKDRSLTLFSSMPIILQGRELAVPAENMRKLQTVQVESRKNGSPVYEIAAPLGAELKKIKTVLYPVYRGFSSGGGQWTIPLPGLGNTPCDCVLFNVAGESRTVKIQAGQRIKIQ